MAARAIEPGGAREGGQIRVVLYSHDSLGLGHLRRNLLIGSAFSQAKSNIQTLLICGTGYANAFRMPDGVDFLSLPSLAKVDNGRYEPKQLRISSDELTGFRSSLILSAIRSFRPNILIVDKVPRGVRAELDPVLMYLRDSTDTKIVLGLRDILDNAERVRAEWREEANLETIDEFYDAVWVYGDPNVYNLVDEYGWNTDLDAKTTFTGYLDRMTGARRRCESEVGELLESLKLSDGFNLVVVGGGADGFAIAEAASQADSLGAGTLIVAGPFMPATQFAHLKSSAAQQRDVSVIRFSNDPETLLKRAGCVVSMGGYNTLLEIVGLGKRPLVVPRVTPRMEQLIRATRFQELGLVDLMHPTDLSPTAMSEWLAGHDGVNAPVSVLDLKGLPRIVNSVEHSSRPGNVQSLVGHAAT